MSTTYTPAPEVEEVARQLIDDYHPHLEDAPIVYIFRDPPAKTRGRELWGKARKISGLTAYLANQHASETAESFLVVEIALDVWKSLEPSQQHALVDHELSHCGWDPLEGASITPHDVEEFSAVISRHGLWAANVEAFVRAGQTRLDLEEADAT